MNSIHLGIFKARGKTLSFFKKSVLSLLFLVGSFASAQQSVSGTVADPSGVPLPGVNVVIKGTNTGASTDFDGNYSIEANVGDVLVFSFVGFETQKITVGDSDTIDVVIQQGAAEL